MINFFIIMNLKNKVNEKNIKYFGRAIPFKEGRLLC